MTVLAEIREFLAVLPPQMRDPVLFAIPFFLLLLVVEWSAARKLEHLEDADRAPAGAYQRRDAWASISMGLVSVATTGAWKFIALLGYAAIYAYVAPWHLSSSAWYTWAIAILGVDLLFYAYHRMAHRVRLVWATHQAHHSSRYFNFATALRQKWNNSGEILLWVPLPLLGALLCVGLFVNAMLSSPERCGVDACGMAMAFAFFGLGYAAGAFLLGAVAATGIVYSLGRQ